MSAPDATTYLGGLAVTRSGNTFLIGAAIVAGAAALVVRDHASTAFDADFERVGKSRMVDSDLLRALAMVESSLNPNAVSPKNDNGTRDYGLMQINEATARGYGVTPTSLVGFGGVGPSIDVAARLLLDMRRSLGEKYSLPALISSYNQGAGRTLAKGILNRAYVSAVMYHHFLFSLGRVFRRGA